MDDSEEENAGALYQEAQVTVVSGAGGGNRFTGTVAAFGATSAGVRGRSTVPAKPRYAEKKLTAPKISGNVLLVERGRVTFQQKALRAQAAGAVACVFINSDNEPFVPFGDGDDDEETIRIPCCCIGQSDGAWLLKTAPSRVSIDFEPAGGWGSQSAVPVVSSGTARLRGLSGETRSSYSDASTASNQMRLSVATSENSVAGEDAAPTVETFARAKFSWKSDHPRDLVFKKGEIIEVLDGELDAAWSVAISG
jgi:hypothetical protein